jgi:putative ABC transport system permease protein
VWGLLFSLFSLVALIMSAAGIYGVMAYFVALRTREIGIRLALGAQRHDVLKLVLRTGMILAVTGLTLGLASAFALSRLMSTLLFEVAPTDPITFVTVAAFLILVALLACYIPARRAMKVDPLVALRNE